MLTLSLFGEKNVGFLLDEITIVCLDVAQIGVVYCWNGDFIRKNLDVFVYYFYTQVHMSNTCMFR